MRDARIGKIAATSVLCVLALTAVAAEVAPRQPRPGEGPARMGPPPEALKACSSLKAEAACSFDGRDGKVSGTCFAPPNRPLACRPKGAPMGPPPGVGKPR